MREEKEFRERATEFFGETRAELRAMREDITGLRGELQAHDVADKEQFEQLKAKHGGIRSSIVKTDKRLAWLAGLGVGVSAVLGLALWLLERP